MRSELLVKHVLKLQMSDSLTLTLSEQGLIEQAQQAFLASMDAYARNKFGLLTVTRNNTEPKSNFNGIHRTNHLLRQSNLLLFSTERSHHRSGGHVFDVHGGRAVR